MLFTGATTTTTITTTIIIIIIVVDVVIKRYSGKTNTLFKLHRMKS